MFTTALDCVLKGCRVCGFRGDAFSLRAHRPLRKFPEGLSWEGISSLKLRSLVVTWAENPPLFAVWPQHSMPLPPPSPPHL